MSNDLVPFNPSVPEIIYEQSQSVEGPEMERILKLMNGMAQNAQLARIRKALERRQIQGKKFTITFNVTPQVQFYDFLEMNPYTALAKMQLINASQSQAQVYVAINDNFDFSPIWVNAPFNLDYSEADERIHYLVYKCDPGLTGTIRLVGTY